MKTIILGAGFSGMAAGIATSAPIYEATDHVGGICRTYKINGYEFDTGGPHWIFGSGSSVEWIKGIITLNTYERRAGVYYNAILPYPIQTWADQMGYVKHGYFKEWLSSKFSREMCNMFFYPFNEKYTAGLMDEILPFDSYKTPPAGDKGHVVEFHNPVGGLNALVGIMAEKCNITYQKRAIRITPQEKLVIFQDGDSVKYDRLISTIPLDRLMLLCGHKNVNLPYSSVYVLNIGAEPDVNFPKEHWLYVPFCKSGFHRAGFYSNVDANKAPEGKVSLSIEIAFAGYDRDDLDEPFIKQEIIKELQAWRWISQVDVVDGTWVKHAYTWESNNYDRAYYLQWAKDNGIDSIGRYGTWKFCGLSESIQMGLNV